MSKMPAVKRGATPLAVLIATRLGEAMTLHPSIKNQVKLGAASGLAQSSVSKILRGEADPSVGTLYALANGLGVPLESLVSGAPVEPTRTLP
jgi:transcriptional regulator with XRE-family HTH domain